MMTTSESYFPYSPVRRVGVRILIMPAGSKVADPDENAELIIGTQDIISMTVNERLDLCGKSFKPRTMVLDVINTSRLSVINDLTGREIRAGVIIDGETVCAGCFYIDRIDLQDGGLRAKITASDTVTRMSRFMTGIHMSRPATLSQMVSAPSGALSGHSFELDETASSAVVFPEMLTDIDTARNCILKLAQAARSSNVWVDRHMCVRIGCMTKHELVKAVIPTNAILRRKSDVLNQRTDIVRVYGKNSSGDYAHSVGRYVNGFLMASLRNDFIYPGELDAIAKNRLEEENFRRRITVVTRCDPAIEVGDRVMLQDLEESLIVVGQRIEFDGEGLRCEMEMAGYKE